MSDVTIQSDSPDFFQTETQKIFHSEACAYFTPLSSWIEKNICCGGKNRTRANRSVFFSIQDGCCVKWVHSFMSVPSVFTPSCLSPLSLRLHVCPLCLYTFMSVPSVFTPSCLSPLSCLYTSHVQSPALGPIAAPGLIWSGPWLVSQNV